MISETPNRRPMGFVLARCSVVVLLVFLAYAPAMTGGYVWDDDAHVTQNEALHSLDGLRKIWLEPGAVQQYYPMSYTVLWAEYQLWGLNAFGYHFVNILLHALNSIALLLILRHLRLGGAWLVAAVFALHPVQVESVAWISELKNCLSGFFYLSAMLAYLHFSQARDHSTEQPDGRSMLTFYFLALVLYICALLSKTVTCSLPAAILLLLWWRQGRLGRRDLLPLLPHFALGLVAGLATLWMEKHFIHASGEDWALPLLDRFLIAGRAVWFYAQKLLWPATLTFNYPRWLVDSGAWWQYLFPLGVLVFVAALWSLRGRIGRGPLAAVLFSIGTLFPALGFFDIYPMRYSYVADHFQYLASIGLVLLWVVPATRFFERLRPRVGFLVAAVPILLLGVLTWQQGKIYQNSEVLYRDTLAKNPNSYLAHYNLATILADGEHPQEALRHYEEAARIKPDLVEAHNNLGVALLRAGRVEEAIGRFAEAQRLRPAAMLPQRNLADALVRQGRVGEGLRIYINLLRTDSEDPVLNYKVGKALMALGKNEEAVVYLGEALRVEPTYAHAHVALGESLFEFGRFEQAMQHYREALRLVPNWDATEIRMAWILATHEDPNLRDGVEAVRLAEAMRNRSKSEGPQILDTLAAAYAEAARFEDATRSAEMALEKARSEGNEALSRGIESRLKLYREGKPFREWAGEAGPIPSLSDKAYLEQLEALGYIN